MNAITATLAAAITLSLLLPPGAIARNAPGDQPVIVDPAKLGGAMRARAEGLDDAIFLPLRKTDVRIDVAGSVIETSVTQEFKNTTRHALEAIYLFPLPSEATITNMELQVGKRIIRSKVLERDIAKRAYELARSAPVPPRRSKDGPPAMA